MFTRRSNFLTVRLIFILLAMGGSILFVRSDLIVKPLQAQEAEKEYVTIVPGVKVGALPRVTVAPLTFDVKAEAGEIPLVIEPAGFWKSIVTLRKVGYDLFEFEIEAPSYTFEVGEPNVPIKVIEVDIPPNAELEEVVLKPELLKTVENVTLVPNQEPLPVNQEELIFEKEKVTINAELYEEKAPYPGKFHELITTGYYGGRKIVILKTFPVQFYPAMKKVEFYRLTGAIRFKAKEIPKIRAKREVLGPEERAVELPVYNIADAETWKEYQREIGIELLREFEAMDFYRKISEARAVAIPCVIICADLFLCPAKDLAAHHTRKGIGTYVVREKIIERSISGKDSPDKIRNFIRFLHTRYNTKWVILFGDVCKDPCSVVTVPTRMAVDPIPYGGVDDGWIPCDYYYACLDGTWDANNNGKYGELADKPDLMPELCVGRIPTNNLDDAYRIVHSIMKYENNPPKKKGALLAANDLGWACHEITFKEQTILPLIKGCGFSPIHRLYQKWNNLTVSTFAKVVNNGIDFIQYYGHGSPTSTQLMSMTQVKNLLKTTPSMPVVFALSCSTSRYDCQECFGEAWIECTKSSGYVGSTRVAYGGLSTGEGLDIRFIKNYCKLKRTGCALDIAKYQLFRAYGWNAYTLKTILEFILFGDPVMRHVN